MGSNLACYIFHLENRSPKYFGTDTIGTENLWENGRKKTEMFWPIAVRNRLTTPYGPKVLGNLKQCTRSSSDHSDTDEQLFTRTAFTH